MQKNKSSVKTKEIFEIWIEFTNQMKHKIKKLSTSLRCSTRGKQASSRQAAPSPIAKRSGAWDGAPLLGKNIWIPEHATKILHLWNTFWNRSKTNKQKHYVYRAELLKSIIFFSTAKWFLPVKLTTVIFIKPLKQQHWQGSTITSQYKSTCPR